MLLWKEKSSAHVDVLTEMHRVVLLKRFFHTEVRNDLLYSYVEYEVK